jgi:ABC-type molybdate transport system substrate-binding protein
MQEHPVANVANTVRVYAAGSTRKAFTEAAQVFTAHEGIAIETTFGGSGLLLNRLRDGEVAEAFASADIPKAQALRDAGLSGPAILFARSRLCAVTRSSLDVTPETLLDVISDPAVKILTPAPADDSTGYYVQELYKLAEAVRPDSYQLLDQKTQRLDVRNLPPFPPGKSPLAVFFEQGMADLFFAYCNSAAQAVHETPLLKSTTIPKELTVPVAYAITLVNRGNQVTGQRFIDFLLSPEGQAILTKWGFTAP